MSQPRRSTVPRPARSRRPPPVAVVRSRPAGPAGPAARPAASHGLPGPARGGRIGTVPGLSRDTRSRSPAILVPTRPPPAAAVVAGRRQQQRLRQRPARRAGLALWLCARAAPRIVAGDGDGDVAGDGDGDVLWWTGTRGGSGDGPQGASVAGSAEPAPSPRRGLATHSAAVAQWNLNPHPSPRRGLGQFSRGGTVPGTGPFSDQR